MHELLGVQTQCILYLFCFRNEAEAIEYIMGWISRHLKEEETTMKAEMRAMKILDISNLPPRGKIDEAESPPSQSHPRLHLKIVDPEIKEAESLPSESDLEKKYKDGEADSETKKFEVFLSFRGEDTRYNFLGYLYEALIQKGFHTFIYDENLDGGESISQELLKVISESRFAIVIISNNYASSTWCLDELAHIIHCKNETGIKVLPIFYHVNPSEVRRQMETFEQEIFERECHFFKEFKKRVEKWGYALSEVSNLAGFYLNNTR